MEAAQERLEYNPNSVVANAIANIKNANNINDKDVNVSFVIDGRTVAQKTFPFIKMMQSNDITLQSRKGAY